MIKRSILASILVIVIVGGAAALSLGASWRGGGLFGSTQPASVVPASADLFVQINRGGTQGAALSQLWSSYLSHPGTAAAVAQVRDMLGAHSLAQAGSLLSSFGDRVGIALWAPAPGGSPAQQRIAIVAQVKVTSLLGANSPLTGLASLVPAATYQGTVIYRVTMKDGSLGYGSVVSGDGVLATDVPTVERVIDTATYHAPSLAADPKFVATMGTLPADPLMLLYVTPRFLAQAGSAARSVGGSASTATAAGLSPSLLRQPYGAAVVAAPDGLSMITSVQPLPAGMTSTTTPNAGADVVGSNAVIYASLGNLAATVLNSGLLPANSLSKVQAQTGVMIQRDVLPLVSHEVVVDVNDETSPLIVAAVGSAIGGASQSVPTLPGSIEVASWVDSPTAAQESIQRLAATLLHTSQQAPLVKTTLADGSIAYNIPVLPGVGYTFRGHWLLLSTSLNADLQASHVPLSADPAYQAALAHVAGTGPLVSVEYMNMSRLLAVVDAWLAYAQGHGKQSLTSGIAVWHQFEPLAAPLRNVISVSRQVGAGAQSQAFVTIKP